MSRIPYKPNKWDYPRFVAFSIIYVAFLILFSPFFFFFDGVALGRIHRTRIF
jgi:hypothetical protein